MIKSQQFVIGFLLFASCEYKDISTKIVEPACTPQVIVSFSKDVNPTFESKCSIPKCHNRDNNLIPYLTTWKEINSNKSDIPFQLQNGAMPPANSKGGQLTSREKALILCWIDQGALDN
jgi:uncharacterized membrane protein